MGGHSLLALLKNTYAIFHRAIAQAVDSKARLQFIRVGHRRFVFAAGGHYKTNNFSTVNIQPALLDQILIGNGIKVTVIDHIVNMTIDIIVHPSGGDIDKVFVA